MTEQHGLGRAAVTGECAEERIHGRGAGTDERAGGESARVIAVVDADEVCTRRCHRSAAASEVHIVRARGAVRGDDGVAECRGAVAEDDAAGAAGAGVVGHGAVRERERGVLRPDASAEGSRVVGECALQQRGARCRPSVVKRAAAESGIAGKRATLQCERAGIHHRAAVGSPLCDKVGDGDAAQGETAAGGHAESAVAIAASARRPGERDAAGQVGGIEGDAVRVTHGEGAGSVGRVRDSVERDALPAEGGGEENRVAAGRRRRVCERLPERAGAGVGGIRHVNLGRGHEADFAQAHAVAACRSEVVVVGNRHPHMGGKARRAEREAQAI